jgi:hypothetical protein
MVTEHFGPIDEPTAEERDLASKKRELVDGLREETARARGSLLPVMRMHGDEVVGFAAYDEFDAVERAARAFSTAKKNFEVKLTKSEKHHGRIGSALLLSLLGSVGAGFYAGAAFGVLSFVVAAACAMPFGLMEPWPDHVRAKLMELSLERSLVAQRPSGRLFGFSFLHRDEPLEIEWIAVGRKGVAFLDVESRPTYVDFNDFSSIYANTQDRHVSFRIAGDKSGDLLTVTLRRPGTTDIPTTRNHVEDTVADFIAAAISTS